MKFIVLVVFSICAVQARVSSNVTEIKADPEKHSEEHHAEHHHIANHNLHFEIFDVITEFIKSYINNSTESINIIEKELHHISSDNDTDSFTKHLLDGLDAYYKEVEKEVSLVKDDNATNFCIDKYQPELNGFLNQTRTAMSHCMELAKTGADDVRHDIVQYTDFIKTNVEELKNISSTCVVPMDPIATVKCILRKTGNIRDSLASILSHGKDVVVNAATILKDIITDARHCTVKAVQNAQDDIERVFEEYKMCVADNQKNENSTDNHHKGNTTDNHHKGNTTDNDNIGNTTDNHHKGNTTVIQHKGNLTEGEMNLSKEEVNLTKEELNLSKEEEKLTNATVNLSKEEENVTKEEVNLSKEEVNLTKKEVNLLTKEKVNPTKNEVNLSKEEVNLSNEKVNLTKEEVNLTKEEVNLTKEEDN